MPFDILQNLMPANPDTTGRFSTVADVLGLALNLTIGIGIALSVIFFAIGGIKMMAARYTEDPRETGKAKKALMYSVVAFVLTISALTIRYIILASILGAQGGVLNVVPL